MRADANAERIRALLDALGRHARAGDRLYLTGGATAVLTGWRGATRDVDILLEGGEDRLLRVLAQIKDTLDINVELASPLDFLPAPGDWRTRSPSVGRFGNLEVFHVPYDLQALAKLSRGFDQDLADVGQMLARDLTTKARLQATLAEIEPSLYRFPTVNGSRLREAVAALPGAP